MTSNILLLDPVLAFLSPHDLARLKSVNKQSNTTIRDFELTQRMYDGNSMPALPWRQRKQLYDLYPRIESLKLKVECPLTLKEFLRPTLKRIDLTLQLILDRHPDSKLLSLWCKSQYLETLNDLLQYLREYPHLPLHTLQIQISDNVMVGFTDRDSVHVGYDTYGPLYEDDEWSECVNGFDPSVYMACLDSHGQTHLREISSKVSELVDLRPWKTLTLPDIFTKPIECDESTKKALQGVLDDIQYG